MHKVKVISPFGSHKKRLDGQILSKYPAILRMGGIATCDIDGHIVLNPAESIYICSDKIKSKKIWLRAGIETPMGYTVTMEKKVANDDAEYWKYNIISFDERRYGFSMTDLRVTRFLKYPKIAKLITREKGNGNGMVMLENQHQMMSFFKLIREKIITEDYYFEDFTSYPREFRLHICKLGLIHAAEKVNDKHYNTETWYTDSYSCDFHTVFSKPKCWQYIIEECQKALKLLKLDVGGFDVKANDKQFTIIECNSGPSVSDTSAEKYKYWIPKLIEHKHESNN